MTVKKSTVKNNLIIQHCIELLQREDLKRELKIFLEPVFNMIFNTINPYIYMFLAVTVIILILLIIIIILLLFNLRNIKN